jgi:ABC-type taurine transport system ATPase subunit
MDRSYAAFDNEHDIRRLPPIPPHKIAPIALQPLRLNMKSSLDSAGTQQPALALEWTGLDYEVKTKKTTKLLVQGVSGSVRAGEMLAGWYLLNVSDPMLIVNTVLGPSGAGKSMLLDLLAGRKPPSAGDVQLHTNYGVFRHNSAYVEQEDALLGVLTVAETLRFSARLA